MKIFQLRIHKLKVSEFWVSRGPLVSVPNPPTALKIPRFSVYLLHGVLFKDTVLYRTASLLLSQRILTALGHLSFCGIALRTYDKSNVM